MRPRCRGKAGKLVCIRESRWFTDWQIQKYSPFSVPPMREEEKAMAQGSGAGPGGNPFPDADNQWHLGYSIESFSTDGIFADVASTQMGDQSPDNPMESNGTYEGPEGKKVVLLNPPVDCVNTGPASTNACTFTSSAATQVDDRHIKYTYRNWGGRCVMSLRVMIYGPAPQWNWGALTPWSSGSPFIVVVPETAIPGTAVVFGKLSRANIFFTPSDPLSATDSNYFVLLEPAKVVPGLGTIYRFKTK
jgi:hypothetical protein